MPRSAYFQGELLLGCSAVASICERHRAWPARVPALEAALHQLLQHRHDHSETLLALLPGVWHPMSSRLPEAQAYVCL